MIVLDDDDTQPENVFEQFELEQGALEKPAHDKSARDTAVTSTELSRTPSISVFAPVTHVVTVHAPLLTVTSAPSAALTLRETLVTTIAYTSALACAATPVVPAMASISRALTRLPFPNRSDS